MHNVFMFYVLFSIKIIYKKNKNKLYINVYILCLTLINISIQNHKIEAHKNLSYDNNVFCFFYN